MKKIRSVIFLFATAMIWGLSFVAQVKSSTIGPFTYNGFKYILGTLSLIPVVLIFEKEKFDKSQFMLTLKGGIITGVVLTFASNLQQVGVYLGTEAGTAGFLTGLYSVLVPIIGFIFFKKKTNKLTWIAAIIAVVGLYLLCTDFTKSATFSLTLGNIIILIGAIFWALHIISIDHFVEKGVSPLKFALVQFATCMVITLILAVIFEENTWAEIYATKLPILYGGVMAVGVAYTLQILAQGNIEPSATAIIMSTESVFSAVGGAILLGEKLLFPYGYIGCALIFGGIVLAQLNPKSKSL